MYTSAQAAAKLRCSVATIPRACKRAGIEPVAGRYLLTDSQIARLARFIRPAAGNPNFNAGNYLGQPRKNSRKSGK